MTIAALPFRSAWQSFYALNAALMFLSGAFVFAMYRSLRRGPANLVFSLAVALAAVYMVPGWPFPEQPTGPHVTPAVGAFRFAWCYALLAILAWEFRSVPASRTQRWRLALGLVAWLLGTLWSCESAAYCAAIWLPAYVAIAWRRSSIPEAGHQLGRGRLRSFAAWLVLPPLLLLGAGLVLSGTYAARLGHGPDWQAFADSALSARAFSLPLASDGVVLVFLLVLVLLSTLAASQAAAGRVSAGLALLGGAWGALWATGSYFVGRSHEVNGNNLNPLLFTAIAVALSLLDRDPTAGRLAPSMKKAFAPILVVLLTMTFGIPEQVPSTLAAIRRGYRHDLDQSLPRMDDRLAALLDSARVRHDDPVAIEDYSSLPARGLDRGRGRAHHRRSFVHRNWAPPLILLLPLPAERRAVYLARAARRAGAGGWLVSRGTFDPNLAWYGDLLRRDLDPTASRQDGDWRLTRYEVRHVGRQAGIGLASPLRR